MSDARHRGPKGRGRRVAKRGWFGYGRTRALLSLGIVLGLGATGTMAYWTDQATVTGGAISSGSMDFQLQTPVDATWRHVGFPSTTSTDGALTISNITPIESMAFNFGARNVGHPNLNYTATVVRTGTWTYVDDPIQVRFHTGTATNSSSVYPRTGTCSGAALGTGPVTVTGTAATVIPARPLTGGLSTTNGQSEQLCVVVSMASAATNDNQSKTGTLQFGFTATQAPS